jgi:Serine/Threonine/Tyrosine Kinase found in polyvalent proteins
MKKIKDELQHIILGNGSAGQTDHLKKVQLFLRRHEETGVAAQKKQRFKSEEASELLKFARAENLLYNLDICEADFIGAGAEQRVYRYDDTHVIKTNSAVFYEYWLDYFNSLLMHNYFFPATIYTFLGFKVVANELYSVVKQEFIPTFDSTAIDTVRQFLKHNHFVNNRNNDYINSELGLIFEDLHDENVITNNGVLFFIDTIFYLTKEFYL